MVSHPASFVGDHSLSKAKLVNRGPWKGIGDLEIAVAEYIDLKASASASS